MAFRIQRRSVAKRLGRLVRKQLDQAIGILEAANVSNAGIHEARTRIKKARSIVKLLRGAPGFNYATANRLLQSAGRGLGQVRDQEAMVETIAELSRQAPDVISPAIAEEVVRRLHSEPGNDANQVSEVARQAAGILTRARKTVPDDVADAGNFFYVSAGMAVVYKRSQSALRGLTETSDAAAFHKWRRRVKEHWYHVRLFEALHPAARARAASLKVLEQELGDAHNLSLLGETLVKNPSHYGSSRSIEVVLESIQKRQLLLRTSALARGRPLFAEEPSTIAASADEWRRGEA